MAHRSGYVALLGKPNAGKSTLLNRILGSHLSIVTPKAQTTRHQVVGIHSDEESQMILLDTPGVITPSYSLQRAMMRVVERSKADADLVVLVLDPDDRRPTDEVVDLLRSYRRPIVLAVNKCDLRTPQSGPPAESTSPEPTPAESGSPESAPPQPTPSGSTAASDAVAWIAERLSLAAVHHVSALTGQGVPELVDDLLSRLPEGPAYYPKDELSEHPMRFFASELIREQIFLQYGQEIPYSCAVEVISYEEGPDMDRIFAEIIVNRESQKGILIGKGGSAIKSVGIESRQSIESFTGKSVFLDLRVKVRAKWREQDPWVKRLGY